MAFQNLRTGSTVYIFHKDNSPKLEIGQVIAEPKIRQKYPIPIPTPGQPYESASYLVGEIIRNMFYNITRKMLC